MSWPKISVVITADRNELFLYDCIQSVQTQTREPDEVIVVYNSFSGVTLQCLINQFPSVRFINTNAKTASSARNHGILNSTGDLVCLLDGDDTWMSEKLDLQVQLLVSKNLDLVYCGGLEIQSDCRILKEHRPTVSGENLSSLSFNPTTAIVTLGCSSAVMRQSLISTVGLFNESLTSFAEDLEFFSRNMRAGKIGFVPSPLVFYRRHQRNESNKGILKFTYWNLKSSMLMIKDSSDGPLVKLTYFLRLALVLAKSNLQHFFTRISRTLKNGYYRWDIRSY